MDDLISRQAAIDAVSEACLELRGVFGRCEDALKALPTVDAVEVVRCKDCIRFRACIKCGFLEEDDGDWYCADGEKKEQNDE